MDEKLKINVEVTGKKQVDDFKEGMKEWRNALRLLELEFKKGKIAGGEYQKQAGVLAQALKQFEDGTGRTATAQNALWHANNRVTLGFKSLATEVSGIHNKMRPAGEQLREFYREQRVGDRTMREGVSTIQMFSGVLGTDISNGVGAATAAFQQAEFAVNGAGIAAQSAGGKFAGLGAAITGAAGALSGLAALGIGEFMLFQHLADNIERSNNELRKLRGETEKMIEAPFWKRMLAKMAGSPNVGLSFFGALATADIDVAKRLFEEQHKIVLDEIVVTGERKKQTKEIEKQAQIQGVDRSGKLTKLAPAGISARKLGGAIGSSLAPLEAIKQPLKEGAKEINVFENAFNGAASRMSNTIGQSLGQGFTDAFGIGHTLLGQFVNDFISQIASIASNFLLSQLFSFIPGLGGASSFLGGAISGGGGGVGPSASLLGGDMGGLVMSARSGGSPMIQVVMKGNFSNEGLAFAVDKGNQGRQARSF